MKTMNKPVVHPCRSEQTRCVFLMIGWRSCEACDTSARHVHRYRSSKYRLRPSLALAFTSRCQADHSLDFLASASRRKSKACYCNDISPGICYHRQTGRQTDTRLTASFPGQLG